MEHFLKKQHKIINQEEHSSNKKKDNANKEHIHITQIQRHKL